MFSDPVRTEIRKRLAQKFPLLADGGAALKAAAESRPPREGWALRFLLAYAPFSDLAEYPVEVFLDSARHGVFLYENLPACRELEEDMFLWDVLFHRVNNEEIVPCRRLLYDCLSGRVSGLSAGEAALAVNTWCCEEASYQSTDERTASPMAVLASARGRCGEESTLLVHALRSVGIPARQVYVPRWAHCDDNHAWVEAYCEDAWRFLGACEPEEALDRGWFVGAASRAMLVNSRRFGPRPEREESCGRFGCAERLNQLERYARTKRLTVRVQDAAGSPVPGLPVDFLLLNYAETASLTTLETDRSGEASLCTGLGTLLLRAGGAEALAAPEDARCTLTVGDAPPEEERWREWDFLSPAETLGRETPLNDEAKRAGKRRLEAAGHKRAEKIAGFSRGEALSRAIACSEHPAKLEALLQNAGGNLPEVAGFLLEAEAAELFPLKEALLRALPVKDLADCTAGTLREALLAAAPYREDYPPEVFAPYLLNPRVSTERLTPYHNRLRGLLGGRSEAFRQDPAALWRYLCERIREEPALEYPTLVTPPVACLTHGVGGALSRKVLFVAACRALGVPARLHEVDGRPEYYRDSRFLPVEGTESAELALTAGGLPWSYRRGWSLARREADGGYATLRLEGRDWQEGEMRLALPPGDYRLVTVNRLPSGEARALHRELRLERGERRAVEMALRQVPARDLVQTIPLGLPLPGELSGAGLWIWLAVGEEPTEHILNEILEDLPGFAPLQKRMVFVPDSERDTADPTLRRVLDALPGAALRPDPARELGAPLARRMYLDPDTAPFALVTDRNGNGAYGVCGYSVGAAEMLRKIACLVMEVAQ